MDIAYLLWIQSLREATAFAADGFFSALSFLGSPYPAVGLIVLIYWAIDKNCGIYLMFVDLFSGLIAQALKIIFCVPRPWIRDSRISPVESAIEGATGYSFPSGHSINAVSVFGGLFVRIKAALGSKKAPEGASVTAGSVRPAGLTAGILRVIMVLSLLMAVLVCFSRNYCEVHTLSDVLAAAGLSIVFLILSGPLMRLYYEKKHADLLISGITIAAAVIIMIYATFKSYPQVLSSSGVMLVNPAEMRIDTYRFGALTIGAFAGFLIEKRFARFTTAGLKLSRRLLRIVFGLILIAIILLPVSSALYAIMGEDAGRIAKYIILAVVLVGIYPCIFTAIERKLDKAAG